MDQVVGDVRVQVISCPCRCWRNFLIATIEPEDRWVTMDVFDDAAIVPTVAQARELFSDPEALYGISHALTLVGVRRETLMRVGMCLLQYRLMETAPDWLLDVPIETVEEIRGLVFGHEMTKTIFAVQSIGACTPAKDGQRPPVETVGQLRNALAPLVVEAWGSSQ